MSWCDKLAATPIVGFGFDWHFIPIDSVLAAISPTLDSSTKDDIPLFTINRPDNTSVSINFFNGYIYGIEPSKIAIAFQHSLRPVPVSGGAPVVEMLSSPLLYTELLTEASRRLKQTTLDITRLRDKKIKRVGIATNSNVDVEDVLPGINMILEKIKSPWPQRVRGYSLQFIVEINDTDTTSDRCLFNFVAPEEKNDMITFNFDWHRVFKNGVAISDRSLERILDDAKRDALAYFEDIAEGAILDADSSC